MLMRRLESDVPLEVSQGLVGLALSGDDRLALESLCWELAEHPDPGVRGTAGLCIGHIGRRFGAVERRSWELVKSLCADNSIDNRPCDALDDLRHFAAGSDCD